jgi:hypothetical protein
VQVHHDEGVANRIDPESCADAREGIGEALIGGIPQGERKSAITRSERESSSRRTLRPSPFELEIFAGHGIVGNRSARTDVLDGCRM